MAERATSTSPAQPQGRTPALRRLLQAQGAGSATPVPIIVATVLLFTVSAVWVPSTLAQGGLSSLLPLAAVLAVAAVGQTLVIQQKGFDLSLPGTITLAGVLMAVVPQRYDLPLGVVIPLTLAVGVLIGILNAFLVVVLNITPLIATLSSNLLLLGATRTVSDGFPRATVSSEYAAAASARVAGLPVICWVAIVVVVVAAVIMAKTAAARKFVAVGNNTATALAAGIRVRRAVMTAYIVSGACGALAGMLLIAYVKSSSITLGNPYLLSVIAAVIVGGTPLFGGRGTIVGSAVAAVFLTQLTQIVLALGAPSSVQLLVQSIAIAAAALLRTVLVPHGSRRRAIPKTGQETLEQEQHQKV